MRRTYDPDANHSYDYLQAGVKEALSASLLPMDEDGVEVALLPGTQPAPPSFTRATINAEHRPDEWRLFGCAGLSTGVYAPDRETAARLRGDMLGLVSEVAASLPLKNVRQVFYCNK